MKIKKDVILSGLQLPMRRALITADKIWKETGEELVITAGLDGVHSAGSVHYYGYAVDLRTRYFKDSKYPPGVIDGIAAQLKGNLGSDYDVVVHSSHIHVEYDKIAKGV